MGKVFEYIGQLLCYIGVPSAVSVISRYFSQNKPLLMATPILRLNAAVSGNRLAIFFSHKKSAENYYNWLESSNRSEDLNCDVDISAGMVSMDLPLGINTESPNGPNDIVLAFSNKDEATYWDQHMIIWDRRTSQAENQRSISRSLTVGTLNEKLVLRNETGTSVYVADTSEAQTYYSGTQTNVSGKWDILGIFRK